MRISQCTSALDFREPQPLLPSSSVDGIAAEPTPGHQDIKHHILQTNKNCRCSTCSKLTLRDWRPDYCSYRPRKQNALQHWDRQPRTFWTACSWYFPVSHVTLSGRKGPKFQTIALRRYPNNALLWTHPPPQEPGQRCSTERQRRKSMSTRTPKGDDTPGASALTNAFVCVVMQGVASRRRDWPLVDSCVSICVGEMFSLTRPV